MAAGHIDHNKVTAAGLLVTLGIIFGDIGTSPLYVMNAIVGSRTITEQLVLGGLSCIFWTLTFFLFRIRNKIGICYIGKIIDSKTKHW